MVYAHFSYGNPNATFSADEVADYRADRERNP
jgi:hypothetical protein